MITIFARVIEGLDVVGATRVSRSNWILHEAGFIPLATELQTATRPSPVENASNLVYFGKFDEPAGLQALLYVSPTCAAQSSHSGSLRGISCADALSCQR